MRRIFVLLLACMFVTVSASGAFAVVYGEEGYESHGKSEADAWEIDSVKTLIKMRDDVNNYKTGFGRYYKLTADIDLSETKPGGELDAGSGWKPIGEFEGVFDGNGHKIKNLSIYGEPNEEYIGLFGTLNGTVKNLGIENLSILLDGDGVQKSIGALAGYLRDEAVITSIYGRFMDSEDVKKYRQYAADNSPEMFVRSLFPDKFREIVTKCYQENYEAYEKLFSDPDFYQKVMEEMADALYQDFRQGR